MGLCDLSIMWPCHDYSVPSDSQLQELRNTLLFAQYLQYTHVAINFVLDLNVKIPKTGVNPIKLDFVKDLNMQIYTRLTLCIDEVANSVNLSRVSPFFDLVSMQPLSEKLLSLAITQDIDIISLRFDQRFPCFLKHKLVNSAIEKGIKFEITYNPLFTPLVKKHFFTNTLSLIRSSRSRGLIISSGARTSMELKSMFDITNLVIVLGLNHNLSNKAMTDLPLKVVLNGRLRNKSYKQLVEIKGKRKLDSVLEREKKKLAS